LLFEKGFDNIYLLTGGIEKFMENDDLSYSMIEGQEVPPQAEVKKNTMRKTGMTSMMSQSRTSLTSSNRPRSA